MLFEVNKSLPSVRYFLVFESPLKIERHKYWQKIEGLPQVVFRAKYFRFVVMKKSRMFLEVHLLHPLS